jgi:UDP-glucuronate 4-epimerase
MEFIETIEDVLGKKAKKEFLPMQPGDVPSTFADVQDLESDVGFKPNTPIKKGIQKFMEWYLDYYKKLP